MKRLIRRTLLRFILFPMACHGFLYQTHVLRKWDKKAANYQYVIGLSDFHDKKHPVNKAQRKQLANIFSNCDTRVTKVLVEDLSSINNNGRKNCGRFHINSRGGILGGLAQDCLDKGLDVKNPEYRFCRVASFGPVLNHLKSDFHRFGSSASITVSDVVKEMQQEIRDIQRYDDGKKLNHMYRSVVASISNQLAGLGMHAKDRQSIADYLQKRTTPGNRLQVLRKILTFDSGLFDLKLVHSVVNTNKSKVIIVAGGSHISRTSKVLQSVGYEPVQISKVRYSKERDLTKCLGSNIIQGKFCVRPKAINLKSVLKFF